MGLISRVSSRTYRLIMEELYTASPTSNSRKSSSGYGDSSDNSWEIPECLRIKGAFEKAPKEGDWTKLLFILRKKKVDVSLSSVISLLDNENVNKKYKKCKEDWYKKDKELKKI